MNSRPIGPRSSLLVVASFMLAMLAIDFAPAQNADSANCEIPTFPFTPAVAFADESYQVCYGVITLATIPDCTITLWTPDGVCDVFEHQTLPTVVMSHFFSLPLEAAPQGFLYSYITVEAPGCARVSYTGTYLLRPRLHDLDGLTEVISSWGQCASIGDCPADQTGDGVVSVPDLLAVLNAWGEPMTP